MSETDKGTIRMDLDLRQLTSLIARLLEEDIGRGDLTSALTVDGTVMARARIEAREDCVVAGNGIARICFEQVAGAPVGWDELAADGTAVTAGDVIARIAAPLGAILAAERTALNLLQRLSGVATFTSRFVAAVEGTPAQIIDTRKTTPGLRLLEKYAVRCGGGRNHRFGLDDGILIKDNHIAALGASVLEAVWRARAQAPHGLRIEVEVTSLAQLDDALAAGADAVLLDNMTPETVAEAVTRAGGKVVLEVSGGVNLDNVRAFAETGVDLISVGALTHSARAIDLALEIEA